MNPDDIFYALKVTSDDASLAYGKFGAPEGLWLWVESEKDARHLFACACVSIFDTNCKAIFSDAISFLLGRLELWITSGVDCVWTNFLANDSEYILYIVDGIKDQSVFKNEFLIDLHIFLWLIQRLGTRAAASAGGAV